MSSPTKTARPRVHFTRPRFGRIPTATAYCGIGRSKIYEFAAVTPGLLKKCAGATLVDFDVLDAMLDALPPADIKSTA
jgi:hypothetical protein